MSRGGSGGRTVGRSGRASSASESSRRGRGNDGTAGFDVAASAGFAGSWQRWVDPTPRPGAWNMAIDQALLGRAARGERWLRLYRWAPACLSFGRHEAALRRYDRARIEALGLPVVRRPTGGRAVWHEGEVTYAVALPAAETGALRAAYLEIHRMLRDALRRLGITAELAGPAAALPLDAGACFARPVGGEILVQGRKVVGSAQLREGGALLQHGAILLTGSQEPVREVTRGSAPPDGSASLAGVTGRLVEPDVLAAAVGAAAEHRWLGSWAEPTDRAGLLAEAGEHLPRFTSDAWTWRA